MCCKTNKEAAMLGYNKKVFSTNIVTAVARYCSHEVELEKVELTGSPSQEVNTNNFLKLTINY